jgi:hypothetical protein
MHPLHAAIVAGMFHMTIDDLIQMSYENEFDDYEIYTHHDFNRMIDMIYNRVN